MGKFRKILRSDEQGATMVENVIILPFVLAVLVVSFDMLLLSANILTVRYTAARVIREVSLGDLDETEFRNLVKNFTGRLGVSISDSNISLCPLASYPCSSGVVDFGEPKELLVVELRTPLKGIFLGAVNRFTVVAKVMDFRTRAIVRREPE